MVPHRPATLPDRTWRHAVRAETPSLKAGKRREGAGATCYGTSAVTGFPVPIPGGRRDASSTSGSSGSKHASVVASSDGSGDCGLARGDTAAVESSLGGPSSSSAHQSCHLSHTDVDTSNDDAESGNFPADF